MSADEQMIETAIACLCEPVDHDVKSVARGDGRDPKTLAHGYDRLLSNVAPWMGERGFTARGFERVPALDHLQGWLANLMAV